MALTVRNAEVGVYWTEVQPDRLPAPIQALFRRCQRCSRWLHVCVTHWQAIEMACVIRALKLDTVCMRRCASACTLMFVAGKSRFLGPEARFRFHRAGYAGMPRSEKLEELDQELARFYGAIGAGPEIAAGELATPNHSFWEPSQGELFAAN